MKPTAPVPLDGVPLASLPEPSSTEVVPASELPIEAEAFLTHLIVERGRSPRTISAYRRDLQVLCGFLDQRGSGVLQAGRDDLHDYSRWLAERGLATSTRARMLVSVRGLYRFLATEGILHSDPAVHLETPRRPDSLPKALDRDQVESILDTVGEAAEAGEPAVMRDRALLEFLYGTGARVSEACGLGFGDLDMDASLVRLLGKRDKERIVPIGGPARRALSDYLDRGRPAIVGTTAGSRSVRDSADAVFLGVRGRRMSRQAVWEAIRSWATRSGIGRTVSPHVMRHSCATHLLEGGADIRIVAELLGHASVSTTQIYTRVANDLLFDAYAQAHPRARRTGSGALS
jgi:integrase/recombinase XerD